MGMENAAPKTQGWKMQD